MSNADDRRRQDLIRRHSTLWPESRRKPGAYLTFDQMRTVQAYMTRILAAVDRAETEPHMLPHIRQLAARARDLLDEIAPESSVH